VSDDDDDAQYEYIIDSAWAGAHDTEGFITCRIHSSLLEPVFGISPV